MSPFTPKNWQDSPSTATPISSNALEDLETRLSDYTDDVAAVQANLAINVKSAPYSATGDGVSDDTTAIQAALTASLLTGAEVYFPPGTYVVSQLNYSTGNQLVGAGRRSSILKMADNTAGGGTLKAVCRQVGASATDFSFRNLGFYGNRANNNHSTEAIFGIHAQDSQRFSIAGCEFRNFRGDGIYLGDSTGTVNSQFAVSDCDFVDCGVMEVGDAGNPRMGVAVIAGNNFQITGNRFNTIGAMAVDLEANTAGQAFSNVVIADNVVTACVSGAVNIAPNLVAEATGIVIKGNTVTDAIDQGFIVKATGAVVVGNTAESCATRAVLVAFGASQVVVTGNNLKSTGSGASIADVYLDSASRNTVVGNTLRGTTGAAGVKEAGTSDFNVFQANQISHATRYVTVGASTETDSTLRRQMTIAPSAGSATLVLTGTSGTVDSTVGILTLRSAAGSQMLFQKAGTEDARFNSSGHFLTAASRKVLATGGLGVGNSAAATEVIGKAVVKKIEVFDATGASIGYLPVYTSIT